MKRFIDVIIIVLLLVSCEKLQTIVDVDLPTYEPKLVVNSINKVGKKWTAYVSVSQAPLSNSEFDFLSDALVLLIDNENIIDTLIYNNSKNRYESSLVVQQGTNFEMRISHPMYNTLNASLYPFERVIIKSVDNLQNLSSETTSLNFTIDDPQSSNFYMIGLKAFFNHDSVALDLNYLEREKERIYFDSDNPSINQGQLIGGKVLFDDRLFNGSSKEFNLTFDSYYEIESDSILLNLWSVDYAFYNYFTTKIIQSNNGDNPIFNSEPVNVYNSFLDDEGKINGYGIYAVSDKDSVIINTK